jgi:hypothetical protein
MSTSREVRDVGALPREMALCMTDEPPDALDHRRITTLLEGTLAAM